MAGKLLEEGSMTPSTIQKHCKKQEWQARGINQKICDFDFTPISGTNKNSISGD